MLEACSMGAETTGHRIVEGKIQPEVATINIDPSIGTKTKAGT